MYLSNAATRGGRVDEPATEADGEADGDDDDGEADAEVEGIMVEGG